MHNSNNYHYYLFFLFYTYSKHLCFFFEEEDKGASFFYKAALECTLILSRIDQLRDHKFPRTRSLCWIVQSVYTSVKNKQHMHNETK